MRRNAQLGHEVGPHLGAAFLQELGADAEILGDREVPAPPGPHLGQHRDELDASFGETVDRLLLVARIVGFGDDSLLHQPFQAIGKNVGRDALFRVVEKFAENAAGKAAWPMAKMPVLRDEARDRTVAEARSSSNISTPSTPEERASCLSTPIWPGRVACGTASTTTTSRSDAEDRDRPVAA